MKEVEITIKTNQRFRPFRTFYFCGMQVAVIGIGVLAGSTAMQWAGFIALLFMLFAIGKVLASKDEGLSFAEARTRIDQIEASEERAGKAS